MKLKDGKLVISEISIKNSSPVCGKSLKDIDIPKDCILISVIRDEEVIIPNGFTLLQAGDYVIAVSSNDNQQILKNFFITQQK
jgi:trk system potassium uptake protein TrkA